MLRNSRVPGTLHDHIVVGKSGHAQVEGLLPI